MRVLVALYNMGGPENLDQVGPFLKNLFEDNDIISLPGGQGLQNFVADKILKSRLEEVKERYKLIGSKSPQHTITSSLCEKLRRQWQEQKSDGVEIVGFCPAYRYTRPHAEDIFKIAQQKGADEIWLLSQYPHCSRATTGSSLRDFGLAFRKFSATSKIKIRSVLPYFNLSEWRQLWLGRIAKSWAAMPSGKKWLCVSAHNIPQSYANAGDPYPQQIFNDASETLSQLNLWRDQHWSLAWQSSVGPVKWLTPKVEDELERLRCKGIEHVLMWPISFVSDHIETDYEIDILFGDLAKKLGFASYQRVSNLNDSEDVVAFWTNLLLRYSAQINQEGCSLGLRDLSVNEEGPHCTFGSSQCLCARYFMSGWMGKKRGLTT